MVSGYPTTHQNGIENDGDDDKAENNPGKGRHALKPKNIAAVLVVEIGERRKHDS
jgi:hypothetical protein